MNYFGVVYLSRRWETQLQRVNKSNDCRLHKINSKLGRVMIIRRVVVVAILFVNDQDSVDVLGEQSESVSR